MGHSLAKKNLPRQNWLAECNDFVGRFKDRFLATRKGAGTFISSISPSADRCNLLLDSSPPSR
jgi:hypothetical protein